MGTIHSILGEAFRFDSLVVTIIHSILWTAMTALVFHAFGRKLWTRVEFWAISLLSFFVILGVLGSYAPRESAADFEADILNVAIGSDDRGIPSVALHMAVSNKGAPSAIKNWRVFVELTNGSVAELEILGLGSPTVVTMVWQDKAFMVVPDSMIFNKTLERVAQGERIGGIISCLVPSDVDPSVLDQPGIILRVTFDDVYGNTYQVEREYTPYISRQAPFFYELPWEPLPDSLNP